MSGTQNRLAVTDSAGNYNFDNVEANGFYTVVPTRANFSFTPAQRSFSQLGLHTEAAFDAAANGEGVNALDRSEYFVRQQYVDFLNREPDEAGLTFWVNNIESCGADAVCREAKRTDTSAAFFLSLFLSLVSSRPPRQTGPGGNRPMNNVFARGAETGAHWS